MSVWGRVFGRVFRGIVFTCLYHSCAMLCSLLAAVRNQILNLVDQQFQCCRKTGFLKVPWLRHVVILCTDLCDITGSTNL